MKRRFTDEQVIGILKDAEAGLKPAELCRTSTASRKRTYYNWKAKFGRIAVSEAQRLKELEQECRLVPGEDATSNIEPFATVCLLLIVGFDGVLNAESDTNIRKLVRLRDRDALREGGPSVSRRGLKAVWRSSSARALHGL